MVKEKEIQKAILNYLALFPQKCFVWRANTGAAKFDGRYVKFGIKGMADIIGVLGGRFLAIEVKRPGRKPDMHQKAFGQSVTRLGGVYLVATSVDDVAKALRLEE